MTAVESAGDALVWTQRIIGIAVLLQCVELLQARDAFRDRGGIWSWEILKQDFEVFPRFVRVLLGSLLRERGFLALLALRALAALGILVFPHPLLFVGLLASTILISMRWRGVFNGGSDYMTVVVLTGLTVASVFESRPGAASAGLGYIALQSCASYCVAGGVKLRSAGWRSGSALPGFLRWSNYGAPVWLVRLFERNGVALVASWSIILFECLFPLALADPFWCRGFLALGVVFHLSNVYLFGLNRFVLAWTATYPALLHWAATRS